MKENTLSYAFHFVEMAGGYWCMPLSLCYGRGQEMFLHCLMQQFVSFIGALWMIREV